MTTAANGLLIEALKDAHAMEVNAAETLESMITTTSDPDVVRVLEAHQDATATHAERIAQRLADHGHEASSAKDLGGTLMATAKGFTDQLRSAKATKNARDAYANAHLEIAAYAMLEALAERAGDERTAVVARDNRSDEEALAAWIAERWRHFVDLTVAAPVRAP